MAQTTLRDRIQNIEDAISAGQIDGAMADCQELLARYPDALEIQRLLGEVYLAQGRLDEAQQTFDWILVNDPENVIAYCDRALICEHQSDIDTALDCYQQAYELSRGNSQIRQEFNHLSAKAGQQEFMLSRAGLARLYMRGDLLTQAIQEWEAVLSITPDRLDARLGLMETYWREGLYDQVEQMASRILEEIPNCEKALLLLSHVTSAFNMQHARELLQRAELLDPELVMAQELFADLTASQPHDPFLAIMRREPIVLNGQANGKQVEAMSTHQYAAVEAEDAALVAQSSSADRLYTWSAHDSLAELNTRGLAQARPLPASEAPSQATWADDATLHQPEQQQAPDDFDAWASQQEIDDDLDPALLEQQPWFQAELAAASQANDKAPADSRPAMQDARDPWEMPTQPREDEAAPAWLDMLTRSERRRPEQATSAPQTPELQQEPVYSARPLLPETAPTSRPSWEDDAQAETGETTPPLYFSSDDKDEDMGWPEWLKSLGAETIEPAEAEKPADSAQPTYSAWSDLQQSLSSSGGANTSPYDNWPGVSESQAVPAGSSSDAPAAYDPWADPPEEEAASYSSWEEQIDATMTEEEKAHLATLEAMEKDLFSQGFVPLQPGALSSLAQESGYTPSGPEAEQPIDRPAETLPAPAPNVVAGQPAPAPVEPAVIPVAQVQQEVPTGPLPHPAAPAPEPVPAPVLATGQAEQAAPLVPAYRADALLESELELTMRRPAVRLQPMQGKTARPNAAGTAAQGRLVDHKPAASNGALSPKEQLVKGYQYQLAGAYDDAMQEYRVVIRNAPELLDEVISNLRALIKLAPRYTAGYRVLGDAYMRQGQYLQAMEAYNKALTMAKKTKSQSH